MFDMRYHIASLVAVFLALTVGIVLGTAIVNRGIVVKQQTALVSGLREEFATLRDRNRALQEAAAQNDRFFQTVLPVLIDKRLAKKRVAVVSADPQDTAGVRSVVISLRQAGARVNYVTISSPDLGTKEAASAGRLEKIYLREKLKGDALRDRLISDLATQLAQRTEPAFLTQLSDIGVLSVSGTDALPAKMVVLLAGSGNKAMITEVQLPLIAALKKSRTPTVGVEGGEIGQSVMGEYQDAGISTVDNVDSPIGGVSLVYALSGSPGNYGTKSTADALSPKVGAE